ncbi:CPBP family intramembrane metalloprotease [Luteolibacter arcticus]|uniref:CPBP family intramembrane metalloprotease n=1 Tax=Luteolibacter arcticus TaxID=1581411 RepID=A0ABT3GFA7_9BACT|nr:CPBP family intramembrane glutamic endopeptidase [Luteolibacter arcticus]MCW1921995.1 CPBP family intramembrane metalloprotease [Luteolibacter arcticus]
MVAAPQLLVSKQAANPYRSILRRHMPEPLLALLIFVMGVWLWDNHFGPKYGWEDGVGRMALRKTDRDLRLADSAGQLPALLRKLLAIPDREQALRNGVFSLEMLEKDRSLDEESAFALGVLRSVRGRDGSFIPLPPDPEAVVRRVAQGNDFWWDREYLTRLGQTRSDGAVMQASERSADPRSREVALRAVLSRGGVWLVALCGLAFLPAVVRGYWEALRSKGRGYVGHWPTALGLGVFLLAYLASIGFGKVLDGQISILQRWAGEGGQPVSIAPGLFVLIDAATRFLPALLAFAFLFRRARHVWTRLGLKGAPDGKLVLGSFALLMIGDQVLRHFMLGDDMPDDPAGGLSEMEEGPWGLVLALTSACIAAPAAEEILYRGVLFRSLANGLRVPAATLISAAVFAVVHFYDAYGLVSVGLLGVACSLCFAASGRLVTAIFLHALYNFAIKVPEWIVYHAPL